MASFHVEKKEDGSPDPNKDLGTGPPSPNLVYRQSLAEDSDGELPVINSGRTEFRTVPVDD